MRPQHRMLLLSVSESVTGSKGYRPEPTDKVQTPSEAISGRPAPNGFDTIAVEDFLICKVTISRGAI